MLRKPSPGLMEAIQSAAEGPSRDAIDRVHEEMLLDFIKHSSGLAGMILVGIHDTGVSSENVEIYAGTSKGNLFSSAAAIVNVAVEAMRRDGEDELADHVSKIVHVLLKLSGSHDGEFEGVEEMDMSDMDERAKH